MTLDGVTYRGKVDCHNVCGAFKSEHDDDWYFGEVRDGEPSGYGVYRLTDGDTRSGRWSRGWLTLSVHRWPNGAVVYGQDDGVHIAWENTNGTFAYDGQPCDGADARFVELKKSALEAEVLRSPSPNPHVARMRGAFIACGRNGPVKSRSRWRCACGQHRALGDAYTRAHVLRSSVRMGPAMCCAGRN